MERLLHTPEAGGKSAAKMDEIGFFRAQTRVVLRNCGAMDPRNIDEYIARRGYEALAKALTAMTPAEVVEAVKASGLRGRGGAGFPTGVKWELAARAEGTPKYVVCNADEGDPGAFMDRSVLEGDPHSVIEAMILAGYAIGASQGIRLRAGRVPPRDANAWATRSARPGSGAFWAGTSSAAASTSTSRSGWAPAPSSAARRPR